MIRLVNAKQAQDIDTLSQAGRPDFGLELMNTAGTKATLLIMRLVPDKSRIVILTGPSNNGGDGVVVYQQLLNGGYDNVTILLLAIKKRALTNTTGASARISPTAHRECHRHSRCRCVRGRPFWCRFEPPFERTF